MLHFGTHGSLEFMPGKQVGMSGVCYPDSLIGSLPNIYYYAANNPSGAAPALAALGGWCCGARSSAGAVNAWMLGLFPGSSCTPSCSHCVSSKPPCPCACVPAEATIAKRRSYANTISYLTPPAENAGLYKGLKELKELISSYQAQRDSGRAVAVCATIIETARQCNLDKVRALCGAGRGGAGDGWGMGGCQVGGQGQGGRGGLRDLCGHGNTQTSALTLTPRPHLLPRTPPPPPPPPQDVPLPVGDEAVKEMTIEERDNVVGGVYRKLMEIESRLLPCGLHVVGCPPTAEEAIATLVNIAELDRPGESERAQGRARAAAAE